MAAAMWHPETGGTFDAPDDAVAHYRASGWLLASEREEHEGRAAERAALEESERASLKAAGKSSKARTGSEGGA